MSSKNVSYVCCIKGRSNEIQNANQVHFACRLFEWRLLLHESLTSKFKCSKRTMLPKSCDSGDCCSDLPSEVSFLEADTAMT